MKVLRRVLLLLLGVILVFSAVACEKEKTPGTEGNNTTSAVDTKQTTQTDTGIDTSRFATIKTFFIGDKPEDTDLVLEEANKILKDKVNAEIELEFIGWSEFETKYSLVLSGGEDVDLMYTSDWCYFSQESAKGAFKELTEDFLTTYMPMSWNTEKKSAWAQATIDGKLYAVPNNEEALVNEFIVAIRDDLRKKYNLPEPKNIDDLELYYFTIAENEEGIFPYHAASENWLVRTIFEHPNQLVAPAPGYYEYFYSYEKGKTPTTEDLYYKPLMEGYKEFCMRMKVWAEKGVWSKNALSNTIPVQDSFENGKSASITWNESAYNIGKRMEENNPGWEVGYYDINADKAKFLAPFTNDCMAIAASSKNPERAAMVLDLLKNDDQLNMLMLAGISGRHYIDKGNKTFSKDGPESDKFPFLGFAWSLKRSAEDSWTDVNMPQVRIDIESKMRDSIEYPISDGFRFNEQPVKAEVTAVIAVTRLYFPLLELGQANDVEATINEFVAKSCEAGLDKYEAEFKAQFSKFMENKN